MRFRFWTKETLAVTAFTVLVVAAATVLHFFQLGRVSVQGALNQAELVARQIYAQNRRALARAAGQDPWEVLRGDRELRSLLDDSVGYSTGILDVLLADPANTIILHSEARKEGTAAPVRPATIRPARTGPSSRVIDRTTTVAIADSALNRENPE